MSLKDSSLGFLYTLDLIVPSDVTLHAVVICFYLLSVSHSFVGMCLLFVSVVVHSLLLCCLIGILKNNNNIGTQ